MASAALDHPQQTEELFVQKQENKYIYSCDSLMENVVGCVFFGLNEMVFPFMVIEVYSCCNCRKVTHIVWSK